MLAITRGLPASGKTTWAREWVAEAPEERSRVNRDDTRLMLFGVAWGLTWAQEEVVTVAQQAAVRGLLTAGQSVVVDDTNLRMAHAKQFGKLAMELGASFEVVDLPVDPEVCIERDSQRERKVGDDVIRKMAGRYGITRDRFLPPVDLSDLERGYPARYEPNLGLYPAWIVDVDGTLAHMNGRGPFDWHRVGEDSVDHVVAEIVSALAREADILVVSGRDGVCRKETEEWLRKHDVPCAALFMRPVGDTRKDAVVKQELFWREIAPHWRVMGVLDDRDRVVEMWRQLGLRCLQVADGNF